MLCCLIMAGGKGERFWPASSEEKPKQFLNMLGTETMLQNTVKRIERLVLIENIFVCTNKKYALLVQAQIPKLPKRNIIEEPAGRNTAPCIILSSLIAEKYYGNVTLIVVPSDHKIEDEESYIEDLRSAASFVEEKQDSICLLGMIPHRAETGYGYIKVEKLEKSIGKINIFKIEKFIEKPDNKTAEEYVQSGKFLWNCGIFVWKISTIKSLSQEFIPKIYTNLNRAMKDFNKNIFEASLLKAYESIEGISIDVSIMEKARNIFIIPGAFKWDDMGTWMSAQRNGEKDSNGNTFIGDIYAIDSKNNFIMAGNKKIILMDIDDLFVIDSDRYTVIGKKELINNVPALKKELEGSAMTNKPNIKDHILLGKKKLKIIDSSIYSMDDCSDNCFVKKGWNIKPGKDYEIAEVQLVFENNKNYLVGKKAKGNWFGIEVNSETVESFKKMKADKVIKFFYNEMFR